MRTLLYILIFTFGTGLSFQAEAARQAYPQHRVPAEKKFNIYPIPLVEEGFLNIEMEEPGELHIEFFDITGKKIKTITKNHVDAGEQIINFNISELKEGIYFCKIRTRTFEKAKRILVRR